MLEAGSRHNAYNISLLLSLAVLTIHFPPLTHFTFAESQSKVTLLGLAVCRLAVGRFLVNNTIFIIPSITLSYHLQHHRSTVA